MFTSLNPKHYFIRDKRYYSVDDFKKSITLPKYICATEVPNYREEYDVIRLKPELESISKKISDVEEQIDLLEDRVRRLNKRSDIIPEDISESYVQQIKSSRVFVYKQYPVKRLYYEVTTSVSTRSTLKLKPLSKGKIKSEVGDTRKIPEYDSRLEDLIKIYSLKSTLIKDTAKREGLKSRVDYIRARYGSSYKKVAEHYDSLVEEYNIEKERYQNRVIYSSILDELVVTVKSKGECKKNYSRVLESVISVIRERESVEKIRESYSIVLEDLISVIRDREGVKRIRERYSIVLKDLISVIRDKRLREIYSSILQDLLREYNIRRHYHMIYSNALRDLLQDVKVQENKRKYSKVLKELISVVQKKYERAQDEYRKSQKRVSTNQRTRFFKRFFDQTTGLSKFGRVQSDVLKFNGITDRSSFRKWLVENHPDKNQSVDKDHVQLVIKLGKERGY